MNNLNSGTPVAFLNLPDGRSKVAFFSDPDGNVLTLSQS